MGSRARLSTSTPPAQRASRIGGKRPLRAPKPDREALELRTSDGISLSCTLHAPSKRSLGDVVLVHGAFSRQSSFTWSGGLADFFRDAGYRVVTFDFRGHGKSGTAASRGGAWSYDDLVRRDLPAVVESLRSRRARGPLWVVGHSLGGHVALAAQSTGRIEADAIVTIGSTLWREQNEPSRGLWLAKRLILRGFVTTAERMGFFPARRFRLGSDDEALGYVRDLARMSKTTWRSADGEDDYDAGLGALTTPIYAIASRGDRLSANPAAVRSFHAPAAGVRFDFVDRAGDGGAAPTHAELVTTMKARDAFARAVEFLRSRP
ncbi:alpha/beta fold hydrolase [soil metagenome]